MQFLMVDSVFSYAREKMNSTFILFATELKSHSFLILFFYFWNLN